MDYVEKVIMKYSGGGAAEDVESYRAMEDYLELKALADSRLELLKAALEFIDGMTLQEAELRMAIKKELGDG